MFPVNRLTGFFFRPCLYEAINYDIYRWDAQHRNIPQLEEKSNNSVIHSLLFYGGTGEELLLVGYILAV